MVSKLLARIPTALGPWGVLNAIEEPYGPRFIGCAKLVHPYVCMLWPLGHGVPSTMVGRRPEGVPI